MYIIYTEIIEDGKIDRWYYGAWNDSDRANEVAIELGNDRAEGIFHCVCHESEAAALKIKNMWS